MWISSEDARSDFILAVAAVVLGRYLASIITQIPGYPFTGPLADPLVVFWAILLTSVAPYLLARYRNHVPSAFGIDDQWRSSLLIGVVVASPLLVAHVLEFVWEGDFGVMLRSLQGRFDSGNPSLSSAWSADRLWWYAIVVIVAIGSWMFLTLLSVRARDAFRSPDMDLTEALRTFGMGAVGATLVFGLLNALRGVGMGNVLRTSLALLAVILLVDQYVPPRLTTTRATVLAPAIAVTILYVLAAGGLFRGDLLIGLWTGTAAGVVAIATTALIEAKKGGAAAVLVVAATIYAIPILAAPIPASFYLY